MAETPKHSWHTLPVAGDVPYLECDHCGVVVDYEDNLWYPKKLLELTAEEVEAGALKSDPGCVEVVKE